MNAEILRLTENNGFAIATMKAFMRPGGGVSGDQIREAITRLEKSREELIDLANKQNISDERFHRDQGGIGE